MKEYEDGGDEEFTTTRGPDDFIVGDDGYKDYGQDEYEDDDIERPAKRGKMAGVGGPSIKEMFHKTAAKQAKEGSKKR